MRKVQFHDTLNGIIEIVYERLHSEYVTDRQQRIKTKISVGEKLVGWERIRIGDDKFWSLRANQ